MMMMIAASQQATSPGSTIGSTRPRGGAEPPTRRAIDVVRAAISAFNGGEADALRRVDDDPDARGPKRTQERLRCSAGRRCLATRPMPLNAGKDESLVEGIVVLDDRRVIRSLATPDAVTLVASYSVDAGRVSGACHSDIDLLVALGVLSGPELAAAVTDRGSDR